MESALTKREGFWYSKYEQGLPHPVSASDGWNPYQFLAVLVPFEDKLLAEAMSAVLAHNKEYAEYYDTWGSIHPDNRPPQPRYEEALVLSYMGSSNCRICDSQGRDMGYREFHVGDWVWPEGYRHYIEVHNVKPSDEFMAFITDVATWLDIKPKERYGIS